MRRGVSYVRSAVEFQEYRAFLKSVPCPRCRRVGCLIRHGYLRGFAEQGGEREIRGWRIFCSNRGRRPGCGLTHCVLLAQCLPRRTVRATRIWRMLEGLSSGLDFKAAWKKVAGTFSLQCGKRLRSTLQRGQSRLRALLCRLGPPPASRQDRPFCQAIEHLRAVFPDAPCPVSAFHLHFQQPLLA